MGDAARRSSQTRSLDMLFLIQYNRAEGQIVSIRDYPDTLRSEASAARLQLELHLHQDGIHHEVVILEAFDRDALRLTHLRYFEGVRAIAESMSGD